MADPPATSAPSAPPAPATSALHRLLARPAIHAIGVYLAARAVTTLLLLTLYLAAPALGLEFASYREHPEFWRLLGGWDTSFFRRIATEGYPVPLPLDDEGYVAPNAWAFLPGYPLLLAAAHAVIPVPHSVLGAAISFLAGAGAAVALRALLAERMDGTRALWGTAFFCAGPVSFVLQVAYTESVFLLLTFAALLAVARRRYWIALPLGLASAAVRPGALALALLLAFELVLGWRERHPRERVAIVVSGLAIAAAGLTWPLVAALVTGRPDAYVATEHAWWVGYVGRVEFVPLEPWFLLATTHLGIAGVVLVVVAATAWVVLLTRRSTRELGRVIVGYVAAYSLYLFAVFLPQQSLFRLALPMSPLLGSRLFTGGRRRRWMLLAVLVVLQAPALVLLWILGYP